MALPNRFMNTYQSRFDVKGRMSIPAPFRTVLRALASDGSATLMLRPSYKHPCIEAWPPGHFDRWAEEQKRSNVADTDEDDLLFRLFADTLSVEPDKEGRIVLDGALVEHAGLSEAVACVGLGDRFQLWEPAAAEQRRSFLLQTGKTPATRP